MQTNTSDTALSSPVLLAIAIAGGTLAYADPVRFDNDGTFVWSDDVFLDLTKPAEEQTGQALPGRGTFQYDLRADRYYAWTDKVVRGSPDAHIVVRYIAEVRPAGSLVPNDFLRGGNYFFSSAGDLGYYYSFGSFYTQFDKANAGTLAEPGYLAARFEIDGAAHYGWMALRLHRFIGGPPSNEFELLAWGYETEPNTPIEAGAVPVPSAALALLAFGAAAGATRARKT